MDIPGFAAMMTREWRYEMDSIRASDYAHRVRGGDTVQKRTSERHALSIRLANDKFSAGSCAASDDASQ